MGRIRKWAAGPQFRPSVRPAMIVPHLDTLNATTDQLSLTISINVRKLNRGVVLRLVPMRRVAQGRSRVLSNPCMTCRIEMIYEDAPGPSPDQFSPAVAVDIGKLNCGVILRLIPSPNVAPRGRRWELGCLVGLGRRGLILICAGRLSCKSAGHRRASYQHQD